MRFAQQRSALADVQLRTLWHSLRVSEGRGGTFVSLALALLWYGFWLVAAAGLAILPHFIGSEDIITLLPGFLLFMMGYWQISPVLTMSLGVSLEYRKVRVYPISVPTLFLVECVLRLGTGSEVLTILAGLWLGLVTASPLSPFDLTLGFGLFVLCNVFLSAGIRNFIERAFRHRRLREISIVFFISVLVLPQMLLWSPRLRQFLKQALFGLADFPAWLLPSSAAAEISLGEARGSDWLVMAVMIGLAGWFGYRQFLKSARGVVETVEESSYATDAEGRARGPLADRLLSRWTGVFSDPLAVMIEKEIKYLWRSPRFRLPFFMGFTFGVFAWLPIMSQWSRPGTMEWMRQSSPALISLYAFLLLGPVMFLNRFGFDRAAVKCCFWLPLGLKPLLAAKNLASAFFGAVEVLLIIAMCWVFGLVTEAFQVVEALMVGVIALLYLSAIGNHMSVRFPIPSDPERISRAGTGHGARAFVQFLLFPISLSPILAAFLARYFLQSETAYFAMLAASTIAGVAIYFGSLGASARFGHRNREHMVMCLSQTEGPIAIE